MMRLLVCGVVAVLVAGCGSGGGAGIGPSPTATLTPSHPPIPSGVTMRPAALTGLRVDVQQDTDDAPCKVTVFWGDPWTDSAPTQITYTSEGYAPIRSERFSGEWYWDTYLPTGRTYQIEVRQGWGGERSGTLTATCQGRAVAPVVGRPPLPPAVPGLPPAVPASCFACHTYNSEGELELPRPVYRYR